MNLAPKPTANHTPPRPSAPVPSSINDDGSGIADRGELVSRIAPLFAVAVQSGAEVVPVFRKATM
jgi:hypothetical protein